MVTDQQLGHNKIRFHGQLSCLSLSLLTHVLLINKQNKCTKIHQTLSRLPTVAGQPANRLAGDNLSLFRLPYDQSLLWSDCNISQISVGLTYSSLWQHVLRHGGGQTDADVSGRATAAINQRLSKVYQHQTALCMPTALWQAKCR